MDMDVDDPGRRASRRLFETAYTRSPYRFTVIGYPDIFNELKPDDIRGYYREKYAPNNVFYVVVGDVKNDEVFAQIRAAYEKTKARRAAADGFAGGTEADRAARNHRGSADRARPFSFCLAHPRTPPSRRAGAGCARRAARAADAARGFTSKCANGRASCITWMRGLTVPAMPGLFGMSAIVDADKFAAARDAMLAEIEKMKSSPVSPDEFEKAVKQFISATLAARKTMEGQAQRPRRKLAGGERSEFFRTLSRRRQTRRARRRPARRPPISHGGKPHALRAAAQRHRAETQSRVETPGDQPIQKFELPNGLRLLVKEDHRLPFVEFRAAFKGGVLAETTENNGITLLLAKMLLKGTRTPHRRQDRDGNRIRRRQH